VTTSPLPQRHLLSSDNISSPTTTSPLLLQHLLSHNEISSPQTTSPLLRQHLLSSDDISSPPATSPDVITSDKRNEVSGSSDGKAPTEKTLTDETSSRRPRLSNV
jgi:hypothetical protein